MQMNCVRSLYFFRLFESVFLWVEEVERPPMALFSGKEPASISVMNRSTLLGSFPDEDDHAGQEEPAMPLQVSAIAIALFANVTRSAFMFHLRTERLRISISERWLFWFAVNGTCEPPTHRPEGTIFSNHKNNCLVNFSAPL